MESVDPTGMGELALNASLGYLRALFNNQGYHTIAVSLSTISNTLLKCMVGDEYEIDASNHPIPPNNATNTNEDLQVSHNTFLQYIWRLRDIPDFLGTFPSVFHEIYLAS